jgi:integrase
VAQIDLEAETLWLDPGGSKNGDGRIVYVTPEIKAARAEQLPRVRAVEKRIGKIVPHVFPSPRDVVKGAQRKTIRQAWRGACQSAGCPHMRRHDLRRTAVGNMLNLGLSERLVMEIVGHRTRSMLDRYHIIAPADPRDAARRMAQTKPRTGSGTARS